MFIHKELIPDWQISLSNVLDRLCNDEYEVLTPPNHAQETSRREQYHEKVTYISFQEGGYPDWTYVRIDRRNDGAEARVLFDPDAYNHDEDTNKEIEKILNNEDEISDRMAFEYQFWTIHITEEKWYQIIDTLFNELHLLEWADEYTDPEVLDLSDQWLLGPALMPCPVTEYKARSRSVYFPEGLWYDFYSGEALPGGLRKDVDAPYARIPLYVRAGSILPVGPAMQWCDEKPADNLLLVVYAGNDAAFTLYEDDGLTYAYEKGAFSTIPLRWDDASRTLTIGERTGAWPGMPEHRTFRVVVADPAHPFAWDPDAAGLSLSYEGKAVQTVL